MPGQRAHQNRRAEGPVVYIAQAAGLGYDQNQNPRAEGPTDDLPVRRRKRPGLQPFVDAGTDPQACGLG